MNRHYWINTVGQVTVLLNFTTLEPDADMRMLFKLKECNLLEFYIFKYFGINLKAPKGKRADWLKGRLEAWLQK